MRKAFINIAKILWIFAIIIVIMSGIGMISSLFFGIFIFRENIHIFAQIFVNSIGGVCLGGILGLISYAICQCLDIEYLF